VSEAGGRGFAWLVSWWCIFTSSALEKLLYSLGGVSLVFMNICPAGGLSTMMDSIKFQLDRSVL
jgi:hypothetical protein